jgi:hypothetical protein
MYTHKQTRSSAKLAKSITNEIMRCEALRIICDVQTARAQAMVKTRGGSKSALKASSRGVSN